MAITLYAELSRLPERGGDLQAQLAGGPVERHVMP